MVSLLTPGPGEPARRCAYGGAKSSEWSLTNALRLEPAPQDVNPAEYTFRTTTPDPDRRPGARLADKGVFISVAGRQAAGVILAHWPLTSRGR